MKPVRDWLHVQLWSTRTSERIGWSLCVGFVLFWVGLFLLEHWLNPWEREAAFAELKQAEVIRTASAVDWKREVDIGKAARDLAEKRAWTLRDRAVGFTAGSSMMDAAICRKFELSPVVIDPRDPAHQQDVTRRLMQAEESMCSLYESSESASRHALNTTLGF